MLGQAFRQEVLAVTARRDRDGGWGQPAAALNEKNLLALMQREIPAVHVRGFAAADECVQFTTALRLQASRAADTSPMQLVGSNFSNHHSDGKAVYFASVADSEHGLAKLTNSSFDPVQRVIERLRGCWPNAVEIADEGAPYGRYFAGCVKTRVAGSAMHYDFVPDMFGTPSKEPDLAHTGQETLDQFGDYQIANIKAQIAWNLYLEMPHETGETTVYDKQVDPAHDLCARAPGARARWDNLVDPKCVEGSAAYTFKGLPGELVLFNTRCPHVVTVEHSGEPAPRSQIGGFAGLTDNRDLVIWS
ncbi:MAG: hypothetical protein HOI95_21555 [Chromatiales bacterium]|jgi:hypothetical protein|nr:hypothetical protein [Chromatiales bacterium]